MKKMFAVLMACVLLLTAIPAIADDVRTSGDLQYTIKGNGTATIVGYTGAKNVDIILPNMIDGYTITAIGDEAFAIQYSRYTNSISVTLPKTVTSIGSKAFANRKVQLINIPDAVEYIGYGAFLGNDEIKFRMLNNHPNFATINGSLYNKKDKELLQWVAADDGSYIVPEGILSIGAYAFYDMYIHKTLKLPESLEKIGDYAFYSTTSDYSLHIPQSVSEIGEYAFAEFGGLVWRITIEYSPKILKTISAGAFYNCREISEQTLDNMLMNVETIEPYAFRLLNSSRIKRIKIPSTCETISKEAFCDAIWGELQEFVISEGVKRIESKAFASNRIKDSVYLPTSLTYIAEDAFDKDVTYVVEKGSYAERWARDNAFVYSINGEEQNLDWLNN